MAYERKLDQSKLDGIKTMLTSGISEDDVMRFYSINTRTLGLLKTFDFNYDAYLKKMHDIRELRNPDNVGRPAKKERSDKGKNHNYMGKNKSIVDAFTRLGTNG